MFIVLFVLLFYIVHCCIDIEDRSLSIKLSYLILSYLILSQKGGHTHIRLSLYAIATTCSFDMYLTPPPFLCVNFLLYFFRFFFNNISLLFHLFLLYLTRLYPLPHNLIDVCRCPIAVFPPNHFPPGKLTI